VQTVAIIGPIFGFLLGSLCARLYVDIGFVKLGKGVYFYLFIHFSFYSFFLMGMV
jgi:solute carrier organic anion transporter family protein 1C